MSDFLESFPNVSSNHCFLSGKFFLGPEGMIRVVFRAWEADWLKSSKFVLKGAPIFFEAPGCPRKPWRTTQFPALHSPRPAVARFALKLKPMADSFARNRLTEHPARKLTIRCFNSLP